MSTKKFVGKVVSVKMAKTVVVAVEMPTRHPIYKKLIKDTTRIKAHASESVSSGSVVEIAETRPRAKQVSFEVIRKVKEK